MALREKYNVVNVFVSAVTPENISRQQLLAWVNDTLQSNLSKIEEMSNGAAYCLLTDRLFPGSVPLRKVKWNPRTDVDSISNWKVLQNAWHDLGITKPVQVQTLMKGKFQDNFEFLQWFRRFYDNNDAGHEYDPLAARNNEGFPISASMRATKLPSANRAVNLAPASRRTVATATRSAAPVPKQTAPTTRSTLGGGARPQTTTVTRSKAELTAETESKYKKEITELKDQIVTWENSIGAIEKERDYYYNRLHKVELLCSELGAGQTVNVDAILSILYQSEDDGSELQEFEAVEDEVLSNQDHRSNANIDQLPSFGDHQTTATPVEFATEDEIDERLLDHTANLNATIVKEEETNGDKNHELDDSDPLNGTFVKEKPKADDTFDLLDTLSALKTDGTKATPKHLSEEQDSY